MSFDTNSLANVTSFYEAIEPWETGYQHNSFAYVAVKRGADFVLVQGILWLNTSPSKTHFATFESENICAGHFKLADIGKTFREFIDDLRDGGAVTPQRRLLFPVNEGY